MTSGFENPILGGTSLIRESIHSPGFQTAMQGWSINQDGTAEFNGLTLHGTLVLGTGTNNVIIMDFTRRAIFVYDTLGELLFSVAATSGTDSFGNFYQFGNVGYDPGDVTQYVRFNGNILEFWNGDTHQLQSASISISKATLGPGANQPSLRLAAPDNSAGIATIRLYGQPTGGGAPAFIESRDPDNPANDMDWIHQGEVKYRVPGTGLAETWHAMALAANWAVVGAPWAAPSYRRSNGGTIQFAGAVQWTAAATAAPVQLTTLPVGYRPISQHHLTALQMSAPGAAPIVASIEVRTDGTVWMTNYGAGGPMTPITLAGLWFPLGI